MRLKNIIISGAALAALVILPLGSSALADEFDDEFAAAAAAEKAAEPAAAEEVPAPASEEVAPASEEAAPEPVPEEEEERELPRIGGEDQLAVFSLHRGLFFSSDVGIFLTFGGLNGMSNVQPYLALKGGYDIDDSLSVALVMSSGYSSGNPLSERDLPGMGGREVVSYGLFNVGGEVSYAIRPNNRFAIEPKIGGGMSNITPVPTDPDSPSDDPIPSTMPHVMGGVDFKYLTLLTDFTAGLSLSGYYVIGGNIPALAAAFVVRYTY